MQTMSTSKHLPDINQISVLSASILLAYTVANFISIPSRDLSVQLPGLYLEIILDGKSIIAFLIAGLTATGADWLIREHPSFRGRFSIQHWLLPALTALTIGLILFQLPFSILWWGIFVIGGSALILVLIAEYIVVDPDDFRRIPATIGLTALSYAFFLTLAITIRGSELRIFLLVPTIAIGSGLTCLRTLHLLHNQWALIHTSVVAIIVGQISAALNYLSLDPVSFGLFLLGPAYALTTFAGGIIEKRNPRENLLEPLTVLISVWGIAILIS